VSGNDGWFYGLAGYGVGTTQGGAVFRVDANGNYQVLHAFSFADGAWEPSSRLTLASDGKLYGATRSSGTSASCS